MVKFPLVVRKITGCGLPNRALCNKFSDPAARTTTCATGPER